MAALMTLHGTSRLGHSRADRGHRARTMHRGRAGGARASAADMAVTLHQRWVGTVDFAVVLARELMGKEGGHG